MTKEESTKIVNLITLRAGVLVLGRSHIVNVQYFFSILVYIRAWSRQIKYKPIMPKEGSAKIVFITIGAGGFMLGHGYTLSSTLSIYITLIAFVL